ncbi:MAG: hypothetical protein KC776_29990 [Myxococcales bacterium]|nr:hypothetical protein [Myxococcales bacterium]MCB9576106.1 hypothetical protein [Polyangiaceae bacterium]
MQRFTIALCAALACVLALLSPATAWAEGGTRVVVGEISGDGGDAVRAAVLRGLDGHSELYLVSADAAGDVSSADGVKAAGQKLGVAMVVEGSVKGGGKSWEVTLRLRSGKDGEVGESHKFRADSQDALTEKVEKVVFKEIGNSLKDAKSPGGGGGVVVLEFSGPQGKAIRGYVVSALKRDKKVDLTDAEGVDSESGPDALKAVGAKAFVAGTVTSKKANEVKIAVKNGADGETLSEFTLKAGSKGALRRVIARDLRKKVAASLSRAKAPEPPAETIPGEEGASDTAADEEEKPADEEEEDEEPAAAGGRPSPLEIGAGMRAFSRNFRYTDDLFDSLRSYKLSAAPAAFVWLRWYPAAHFTDSFAANIGLAGGFEQGFALKSKVSGGKDLTSSMRSWYGGLRVRVPFELNELGVQASYGRHSFTVDDDPQNPLVPDVDYQYVRLGLDGRVRVSKVTLGAHFGYRYLLGTGDLESDAWFPNATGGGVDAGLMGGYEVVSGLSIVAGFDFRRYFFSLKPDAGAARVAGGALDEYLSGWGGLMYRIPDAAAAE